MERSALMLHPENRRRQIRIGFGALDRRFCQVGIQLGHELAEAEVGRTGRVRGSPEPSTRPANLPSFWITYITVFASGISDSRFIP
jgi:hypothetical protein